MFKNYKKTLISVGLFFSYYSFILFLSILLVAYIPLFYQLNYSISGDNYEELKPYTNELISYFLYFNVLDDTWSQSEQKHYEDVRFLYSFIFVISVMLCLLLRFFKKYFSSVSFSKYSLVLLYSHLLIFIDFEFFWDSIFHPLLFSNTYWIIYPGEISYLLFSYDFFILSIIFIILINTLIHGSIIFKEPFICYSKKLWNHFK